MDAHASRLPRGKIRIFLASSNEGKLREYRELAVGSMLDVGLIPGFRELPAFEESAPTFAEVAAGKALHYSGFTDQLLLADDSGLVVPALGGEPGVRSARYAGARATDAENVGKLLHAVGQLDGEERRARFVCVIAIAQRGRILAVVSDRTEGFIAESPRGTSGFGYDPIFYCPELGRTFAEASAEGKNRLSHRGKAFRKIYDVFVPSRFPRPS